MADGLRIVLTGGLSGGHVTPLVAVARELRLRAPGGVELLYIGSRGPIETEAMEAEGIPLKFILYGKYRRYFSVQNFFDLFRLPVGVVQALWHLTWFMPDAVLSKGGAVSVPVTIAALILWIPVLIHDSDAVPGRTTRMLGRFVKRIAIAYPQAALFFPADRTALTGNPVRQEILEGDVARARARFAFPEGKPVLLALGGSLGAWAMNSAVVRFLPQLLKAGIHIIHQTGKEHIAAVKEAVAELGIASDEPAYRAYPYFSAEELSDAYEVADLVISRAGATTIAELAAKRKAVILVPLSTAANDEQRVNAYAVAAIGGALVIEDENLVEHILLEKIAHLLNNAELRSEMAEKLAVFHHPDAAQKIAEGVLALTTK